MISIYSIKNVFVAVVLFAEEAKTYPGFIHALGSKVQGLFKGQLLFFFKDLTKGEKGKPTFTVTKHYTHVNHWTKLGLDRVRQGVVLIRQEGMFFSVTDFVRKKQAEREAQVVSRQFT